MQSISYLPHCTWSHHGVRGDHASVRGARELAAAHDGGAGLGLLPVGQEQLQSGNDAAVRDLNTGRLN